MKSNFQVPITFAYCNNMRIFKEEIKNPKTTLYYNGKQAVTLVINRAIQETVCWVSVTFQDKPKHISDGSQPGVPQLTQLLCTHSI